VLRVRTLGLQLGLLGLCFGASSACGHGRLGPSEPSYPRSSATTAAGPTNQYVETLVARARAAKLWEQPQWHKLLHYRLGVFGRGFLGGGYTSEADGIGFFLDPRGKVDPQAELEATVRSLFAPLTAAKPGAAPDSDEHPLCRFPARFMFLRGALDIDARRLPVTRCPRAEQFMRELDSSSLSLIFSAYYLNNPASAFGHTFLRFNRRNTLATGERRELLDYGIDYSADVDTGNAIVYAIKGLTGMFPGTFKRLPYYYKVRAYNDYESRDLWEYELNLQPAQLLMLSAHLWELGHTYFAYFYLSENCSYHILSLLEAADPSVDLISHVVSPVIPADTVKALYEHPGFVRRVAFRPSLRRQFESRVEDLDSEQRDVVEELSANAEHPLPASVFGVRAIEVLDAAVDLVDVLYARELVHKTDSDAARRKQRLLERRAEILRPSKPVRNDPPYADAPEHGHGSRRLGLGAATADREWAASLEFRLALHDLADASPGYPELSAIEFMRARVQIWAHRLELEDASLIRVTSLNPWTRFDKKMSWEFDVGATTLEDAACDHCLAPQISGGAGSAFELFDKALTVFAMAYGWVGWTPEIDGLVDSHFRLGVGPRGGVRIRLTEGFVVLAAAQWLWLPGQTPNNTYRVDAGLRLRTIDALALGLEGRATPNGLEAQILAYSYF
jgi:hypothetical protein